MERLKFLFTKYKNTDCTPKEVEELLDLFAHENNAAPLMDEISAVFDDGFTDSAELTEAVEQVYGNLHRDIFSESQRKNTAGFKLIWLKRFAVAASIVLIAGISYFYYISNISIKGQTSVFANDVNPGQNKATLHLANGKVIDLSTNKKGIVINGSSFNYNDGATITSASEEPQTVVIETPKGGQYEAVLPDGTHIWLNADTKLSFPSKFTGADRTVILSGEAYFQVAHNKAKPFKVISKGQEVEVLGTHFNVNTYADEPAIRTTLLEGLVRVNHEIVLRPGEQSVLTDDHNVKVEDVNLSDVMAWKEGLFRFSNNENIVSIMRRVARWYDVDFQYVGDMSNANFTGKISRFKNISVLLERLELTGMVKFKIEGRKIIVQAL